jgi:hypothetical protein
LAEIFRRRDAGWKVVDVDRFAERVDLFWGSAIAKRLTTSRRVRRFPPSENWTEHLLMCWPGAAVSDRDYPVERLGRGFLSGGWTTAPESGKQGLVYWVGVGRTSARNRRVFMGE